MRQHLCKDRMKNIYLNMYVSSKQHSLKYMQNEGHR